MPKAKVFIEGSRKMRTIRRKFAIGGRKSVRSAKLMSNLDLQKVVDKSDRGKDRQRARNELTRRAGTSRILKEMIETAEGLVAAGTSDQSLVDELKAI